MRKALNNTEWINFGVEPPRPWTPSRRIKREYIKRGYKNMLSLYGALRNYATNTIQGNRIEILLDQPPTEEITRKIYDFFTKYPPPFKYSIWIYNTIIDELNLIWRDMKNG